MRPVGRTSRRPREGAPEGPGVMNLPSSASRKASISAGPEEARRGLMNELTVSRTARVAGHSGGQANVPATRSAAMISRRSTMSPVVRTGDPHPASPWQGEEKSWGRGPDQGSPNLAVRGSKPSLRSSARARISELSPGASPRGILAKATARSRAIPPSGECPKTCRPSRIWASFKSQRKLSILIRASVSLSGRPMS